MEQQLVNEVTRDAESYLAEVCGKFSEKGINARSLVTFGLILAGILDVAKGENVDLIAMTSHGRGGLSRVFYGSIAAGVLHGVDRPLLLVRVINSAKTKEGSPNVTAISR